MNYKLCFWLSMPGLFMALATVYFIPTSVEWICWLAIFLFCGWMLSEKINAGYFVHGFVISLFNCVWVTAAHVILFDDYATHHSVEVEMMKSGPASPQAMMLVTGPVIGILSGLVQGIIAWAISKLRRR
ncbi:MAG: hypothetical protein K1X47_12545 [Cyclobacteriaceae bacterium]|nr:hypothetical protein [Cyclobacteriaceae bacterium]